ncbi:MAG: hypothetical protein WDN49_22180 [Acetobacteraceae bacterium]
MAQCLDDLEDNRVAQGSISDVELACHHHPLGELTRRHRPIHFKLADANVGDFPLLEEAVADQIARTLLFGFGKEPQGCVEMGEIMFRLGDLRLIGSDPTQDLRPQISQRLNHQ